MKQLVIFEVVIILVLFFAALYIRLHFVFGINHPTLLTDAFNYDVMTKQFLEKGFLGYLSEKPNAYVTPGYPFFLALIYTIFGYHQESPLMQVRVIQSVIGALTCLVVYLIGKKIKNKTAGIIAGCAYALYPTFAWSCTLILTEVLYNFFFLVYMYFQLRILETKSKLESFLCGIIFAVAVMVRPLIFPLFAVPFLYQYYIGTRRDKRLVKLFIYAGSGVLLVMIPWWIRNVLVLNKFILLATQTGNPLIAGCFPYFANIDVSHYNVSNQFHEGIRMIINGFKTQPLLYLKWFTIGKLNFIFGYPWYYAPHDFTFLKSLWNIHYFAVTIGWLGVVFSLARNKARIIGIYAIMLTGLQLLFVPEARYAYSIIPLLMILMGYIVDYVLFSSKEK